MPEQVKTLIDRIVSLAAAGDHDGAELVARALSAVVLAYTQYPSAT